MTEDFHPEAARNFAEKGRALLNCLEPRPEELSHRAVRGFPNPHLAGSLESEDILEVGDLRMTDGLGRELARYFVAPQGQIGLHSAAHGDFMKLCEAMHRTRPIRDTLTEQEVADLVFAWIRGTELENMKASLPEFVREEAGGLVSDHQVMLPIYQLRVQATHSIGNVVLRPVTSEEIAAGISHAEERADERTKAQLPHIEQDFRRRLQGRAAVEVRVRASKRRALEIALKEAELAIAAIRMFSPAAFEPLATCFSAPLGQELVVWRSVDMGGEAKKHETPTHGQVKEVPHASSGDGAPRRSEGREGGSWDQRSRG